MKVKDLVRFNTALQAVQESCVFIPSSELVPDEWSGEFWELFGEGAAFTWGDNSRTLITLERFVEHANAAVDVATDILLKHRRAYNEWMSKLEDMCSQGLSQLYIDLES